MLLRMAQLAAGPVLTPDPRRMAESWRRGWNVWLPEASELRIGDETFQEVSRTVELADLDLRTAAADSGYGREQAGFVGLVRLGRKAAAGARAAFGALVRFAEFSGTGAQTTHGFGATRCGSQPW